MATKQTMSVGDRLRELQQLAAQAAAAVRDVEHARREAAEEAAQMREEVVNAYASDDAARAQELAADLAALEANLASSWAARLDGARLAAERARGEIGRFASANLDALRRAAGSTRARGRRSGAALARGPAAARPGPRARRAAPRPRRPSPAQPPYPWGPCVRRCPRLESPRVRQAG